MLPIVSRLLQDGHLFLYQIGSLRVELLWYGKPYSIKIILFLAVLVSGSHDDGPVGGHVTMEKHIRELAFSVVLDKQPSFILIN
jgi:hypothetical protein